MAYIFNPLIKRLLQKVEKVINADGLNVNGDVNIAGDLTVQGKQTSVDVQTVESENDYILMRYNNTLGLADGEDSGLKILNYDGNGTNLIFGVDNNGWARIGDEGTELQRIATIDVNKNSLLRYDVDEKTLKPTTAALSDIWIGTTIQYNALATKSNTTLYLVTETETAPADNTL